MYNKPRPSAEADQHKPLNKPRISDSGPAPATMTVRTGQQAANKAISRGVPRVAVQLACSCTILLQRCNPLQGPTNRRYGVESSCRGLDRRRPDPQGCTASCGLAAARRRRSSCLHSVYSRGRASARKFSTASSSSGHAWMQQGAVRCRLAPCGLHKA